jgi:hypothetical protein
MGPHVDLRRKNILGYSQLSSTQNYSDQSVARCPARTTRTSVCTRMLEQLTYPTKRFHVHVLTSTRFVGDINQASIFKGLHTNRDLRSRQWKDMRYTQSRRSLCSPCLRLFQWEKRASRLRTSELFQDIKLPEQLVKRAKKVERSGKYYGSIENSKTSGKI